MLISFNRIRKTNLKCYHKIPTCIKTNPLSVLEVEKYKNKNCNHIKASDMFFISDSEQNLKTKMTCTVQGEKMACTYMQITREFLFPPFSPGSDSEIRNVLGCFKLFGFYSPKCCRAQLNTNYSISDKDLDRSSSSKKQSTVLTSL